MTRDTVGVQNEGGGLHHGGGRQDERDQAVRPRGQLLSVMEAVWADGQEHRRQAAEDENEHDHASARLGLVKEGGERHGVRGNVPGHATVKPAPRGHMTKMTSKTKKDVCSNSRSEATTAHTTATSSPRLSNVQYHDRYHTISFRPVINMPS